MNTPRSSGVLLLVSAPSGGGKTTVCTGLLAAHPGLRRVVTCTTRPPRAGEVDGVDYHFFGRGEFEARVAAGDFLETPRCMATGTEPSRSRCAACFAPGATCC
ncbi:MAG: guanylate kinase [Verrucomicrobiota bacterium]